MKGNLSPKDILGTLGAHAGRLNFANSASTLSPVSREGSIALPLLSLDGSHVNSLRLRHGWVDDLWAR
jgi:hypothetical protein